MPQGREREAAALFGALHKKYATLVNDVLLGAETRYSWEEEQERRAKAARRHAIQQRVARLAVDEAIARELANQSDSIRVRLEQLARQWGDGAG